MKANKAPEKIILSADRDSKELYDTWVINDYTDNIKIEYTRTDAFIEKVSKWLEENAHLFVGLADEDHPAIGDTKACYGTKSLIYYFKRKFEL